MAPMVNISRWRSDIGRAENASDSISFPHLRPAYSQTAHGADTGFAHFVAQIVDMHSRVLVEGSLSQL